MITEKEIRCLGKENQAINLIKEFRAVSNFGLKDSKDKIETCRENFTKPFDIEKLLAVFAPYLKTPEQLEQERQDALRLAEIEKENLRIQAENDRRKRKETMRSNMLQGVQIAFDNFEQLGFDSPFFAVRSTLENFQEKWDE